MSQISLQDIRKSFGETPVLKGVSLDIEAGEFVTLVGPSGCGKSTLLRVLAGLEAADSGQVTIQDRDVTAIRPADRNLAMVFQSYALYPHLTVAENMMTPLRMRDLDPVGRLPLVGPLVARGAHRKMRAQVAEVAETLQITQLLDRKPGQLSGGQRQRAALGRAMVREPVAFLMDEPLSNLDAALRVHMRAELSEMHRRLRATFVYVTHDQAEALTMSDRMAVMMHGHILQVGPPEEVYRDPQTLEVAKFIGSPAINTLPGDVDRTGALLRFGQPLGRRVQADPGPVTLALRPEHLELRAGPTEQGLTGRLVHRENLGADHFLHVAVADGKYRQILRAQPDQSAALSLGDEVHFDRTRGEMMVFGADGARLRFVGEAAPAPAASPAEVA